MTTRKKVEIVLGLIIVAVIAVFVFGMRRDPYANTNFEPVNQNSPASSRTPAPTQTATSTQASETLNFSETGNIVNQEPTRGNTNLRLVYEKPGAPALTVDLLINEKSMCGSPSQKIVCMAMSRSFENGLRVKIDGVRTGNIVEVRSMTFMDVE